MEYAATAYTDLPAGRGVAIGIAAIGKPEEDGFAKRLMRTTRGEEIDLSGYRDFADAYGQLGGSGTTRTTGSGSTRRRST